MSWASVAAARLLGLFKRKRLERELDAEVRFHLEMQVDDNVRAGMKPEEARYAALRSFGGIDPVKEAYREGRAFSVVETTAQDVRYALRTLRGSPGFTITALAVLGLAIGINTAMFSVLNAVLLRPLPYRSPEQLVMLWSQDPGKDMRGTTGYWNVEQWRRQNNSFVDLAFFDGVSATLTTADRAEKISAIRSSASLFEVLGVQPLHGRIFTAEEAEQRQRLALISHRFWQSHFGGSFDAIGTNVHVDGAPSQIIGILPADFRFSDVDVWEPHTMYPEWEASLRNLRGVGFWAVLGRLRPNVTVEQAQAEMNAIAGRLDEQMPPGQRNRAIAVVPLSLHVVGARPRLALRMLAGAVFLVLLIAATNVASLSLARSASREREMAIRAALGASRTRIIRQLLAESLALSVTAGFLGLLVAYACIRVILAAKPGNLPGLNEVSLDSYVLGCALALCLLTGILVGLTPALTAVRRDLKPSSQEGGKGVAGGAATLHTRRVLVLGEFSLAIILLAGAGLLVRSLLSVQNVDLGFRPERVLSVSLAPRASTTPAQRNSFYRSVIEQVESVPGVESAGVTSELFLSGSGTRIVTVEGDTQRTSERRPLRSDELSEGLFKTVRTPLLKGRFFEPADGSPDSPLAAIVNETMARNLWPGGDPVGKRFKFGPQNSNLPWFTVVGVVGDMRRQGLEKEPISQMFEPLAQNPPGRAILLVRTSMADPLSIAGAVQEAVRRVEKYAPVYATTTLESQLDASLAERRFQTTLLVGFSVAAFVIAAIGIYGLIQYSVVTRTREIGIRIALGAQSGQIVRMIMGEGLKLSLAGMALGLLGAVWIGRAGSSLLFGVTATDPLTFVTVSLLLTAVAAAACYFPARRAMKLEPTAALRQQ